MKPRPYDSKEEFARRGDEIYGCDVRLHVETGDEGKSVAIDIDIRAYEIDEDELAASDHLLARNSDAQLWVMRVASTYPRRFSSVIALRSDDYRCRGRLPQNHHPPGCACGLKGQEQKVKAVIDMGFESTFTLPLM